MIFNNYYHLNSYQLLLAVRCEARQGHSNKNVMLNLFQTSA